jgi:hypothetical protein
MTVLFGGFDGTGSFCRSGKCDQNGRGFGGTPGVSNTVTLPDWHWFSMDELERLIMSIQLRKKINIHSYKL